jgi:hypothetical protein
MLRKSLFSLGLSRSLRLAALPATFALVACSSASAGDEATATSAAQSVTASATPALSWVGGTQLAYDTNPATAPTPNDVAVDASFVVAANPLTVLTDVYPEHSATQVTLFWANADYSSVASAPMALAGEGAGAYGNNDRYRGTLPAAALQGGLATHYWVSAQGDNGDTLYDSQNGANYTVTPRALAVSWAGNLGAYDAQGGLGFYRVGNLFNSDLSTSVGCFWEGADDYQVQAIEVYVPGLTDQGYTGSLATVATALLQAQMWTDLRADGWGAVPTSCRAGIGNNYVCQLTLATFPEGGACLVDGPVAPGDYEYKVRFSVDGGTSWYWVGSTDGAGGGDNLRVQYDPGCLYSANDPFTCSGSPLFTGNGSAGGSTEPGTGSAVKLTASVGATASSTSTFTNGTTATTLQNVRLVGTDAAKFTLAITKSGAAVTGSTVAVAANQVLDFAVTYRPTASTAGSLPDMVDVAWDTTSAGVTTTTYGLHARGVTQ